MSTEKMQSLAKFLDCSIDEVKKVNDNHVFRACSSVWAVFTDDEATENAMGMAKDTLWAFKTSFLFPEMSDQQLAAIARLQFTLQHCANSVIEDLLGDTIDDKLREAIEIDERGHFIALKDGIEHRQDEFFIYRLT